MTTIQPTQHEKMGWALLAMGAYAARANSVGHTYSVAASLPRTGVMAVAYFDQLQAGYRAWLVDGTLPE